MKCDEMPPYATLDVFCEDRCDLPAGHHDAHRARDLEFRLPWRWMHDPDCECAEPEWCGNIVFWPEDWGGDGDPEDAEPDPPTKPEPVNAR